MSRREAYSETFTGRADERIRVILGESKGESEHSRLKKILVKVIQNELTEKQRNIVLMYYYKNMDMTEISKHTGVTVQAVSATMARARLRIYKILKYYI
ncbi:MAG: sigma-70 family RNA polymerase sigma factor [Ruminococcus sp.]|nr:sigma-70 family RNA polymerase sigma factor [Ruminococcus sp.]MDE7098830.1 sigma-70 family RNA polymerase sigma factor [Ruminococcus sp.]